MAATSATSSADTADVSPRAPETPLVDDEGVSALQRAFFQAEAAPRQKGATLHRCASAPGLEVRESVAAWHLAMVVNAISAAPKHAPAAPLAAGARRASAADLSVLSQ